MQRRKTTSRYKMQVISRPFYVLEMARQLKIRMQGPPNTSRYKCKIDRGSFFEVPQRPKRECKVEQLHLDTHARPTGFLFWNAPTTETGMQGRTTTSRYEWKPIGRPCFFCWDVPVIKIKNAKSTNYISTQMQPIGRPLVFVFFFLKCPGNKTRMQGRTLICRYKFKTGRRICCLECPAIKIKNARSNNYISINMQGQSGNFLNCSDKIKMRMHGRTITSRYKWKTDRKHLFSCLNAPAIETSMQGRTTTSRYQCKTNRKTFFCLRYPGN